MELNNIKRWFFSEFFLYNIDFIDFYWFLWVVLENEKFKKASWSQEIENLKIL